MSAGDNLNLRIRRASLLDNAPSFEHLGNRDNQITRVFWISPPHNVCVDGISGYVLEILVTQLGSRALGSFDHDKRQAALMQLIGYDAADAAISDKDGAPDGFRRLGAGGLLGGNAGCDHTWLRLKAQRQPVNSREDQWIEHD